MSASSGNGIIVVGGGQASVSLVAKLRGLGYCGPLTLIGAEPILPYQRPPLSKAYLLGEMGVERLLLKPASFYADHDIDLRLGQFATRIDRGARTLQVGDETFVYSQLALATGSTARRLPLSIGGGLRGVHTIRNFADVDAMAEDLVPGKRLIIVGGGYIGLEAAAVAAKLKLDVTVIETATRILQRVASTDTATYFRNLHAAHGVKIIEGIGVDRLTGNRRVRSAVLTDGRELPADLVIVGVGIVPAIALAETAGLHIDNGISTDEFGRTTDPSIWAAGDCASFPSSRRQVRLESVGHAIDHAECVAANMLGAEKRYVAKPWFWSDQYDVKLQIAGLNSSHDRVVARGSEGVSRSFWYYRGDKLLALDAINDPRAYMVGKRLIETGQTVAADSVADTSRDIKSILAEATEFHHPQGGP
ncbi:NAD(P)/FAD-dependent oxidoreductase [Mesorhizobium sp. NPDC059054]|uniref:NAD(P)/FAD-dependent oxidoreductase n=1 Tax=Mesorhizobium sp. NPDC059054 TaxID=3346711 RepID=UPI0036B01124